MPHKHKRKRDEDESNFDLAPTSRARTLSVHQKSESIFTSDRDRKEKLAEKQQQRKRKRNKSGKGVDDDTPKAFARLMAFQNEGRRIPNGLDDGVREKKGKGKGKWKASQSKNTEKASQPDSNPSTTAQPAEKASTTTPAAVAAAPIPKILPGERLSDFSLRVDQSLPLTGVPKHTTRNNVPGLNIKTPLTKHNKRLARMQRDWRTQEAKIRDREEEAEDDLAEKREEEGLLWLGVEAGKARGKGKKKKKREMEDEADPWKVLERKRREQERAEQLANGGGALVGGGRTGQSRGLSAKDTVQAPPVLKPIKNIFKERT
ncbi:uncharacterized protein A1O9_10400 [Exophiala aquamarina CBS 119918]|uniref:Uncharacterized protein n=1 Tax=Exophiala aquamarina CBS 119918 TaxID=1182545 RepID=A0A072PCY8_9EURO|nr:uncharacterized protein A1O9_10400 [Exophiala aquamarina CBS 119918]KEF53425.1 hypothetical protein A1O9_10400 [Exophiala aquamarina CBS 119918]